MNKQLIRNLLNWEHQWFKKMAQNSPHLISRQGENFLYTTYGALSLCGTPFIWKENLIFCNLVLTSDRKLTSLDLKKFAQFGVKLRVLEAFYPGRKY